MPDPSKLALRYILEFYGGSKHGKVEYSKEMRAVITIPHQEVIEVYDLIGHKNKTHQYKHVGNKPK